MRTLAAFLLLPLVARADHLVETGKARYVGAPVAVSAISIGQGYLPAVQLYRSQGRGHFRLLNLTANSLYETRLGGIASGMARHGGNVVLANLLSGQVHVWEFYERIFSHRERAKLHGTINVQGFKDPKVLRLASLPHGPLLVVGHGGGLVVATVRPRGQGATDLIARPGRSYAAVTAPFHADRNGAADLFAVGGGRVLHLEQQGRGFKARGEVAIAAAAFRARAATGTTRQLWIGGSMGDRAGLLYFLPQQVVRAGAARAAKPLAPAGIVPIGRGNITHVEILDPTHLVVAGTREGRAWVGVLGTHDRPAIEHETYLPGTGVTAVGLNPARVGWTLCVSTSERTLHVLRMAGDAPKPLDWMPNRPEARDPEPEPIPEPEPKPVPVPRDDGVRDLPHAGGGGGGGHDRVRNRPDEGLLAILPRVQASRRTGTDTDLVLVYLGSRPTVLTVRFVENSGAVVKTALFRLRSGQRGTVTVGDEVGRRRGGFDGYVLLEGCRRADLVVEAVLKRADGAETTLRAHWR